MYDIIGDIHGHADKLSALLEKLGYQRSNSAYAHPQRKVLFLGDFIDRGPFIRETLQIVRGMIDSGSALAVMGNHELNALAYATPDPRHPGEFLRPHTDKNRRQHAATLDQLSPDELRSSLDWFRTLPLWLDFPELRIVHACWDSPSIRAISHGFQEHGGITDSFLASACIPDQPLFHAVEIVLKGREVPLPGGVSFVDKDGHVRTHTRTRWYSPPHGHTYRTYAMIDLLDVDHPLDPSILQTAEPYPPDAKPVFVGHYWLLSNPPTILAPNVACLDYSVAKQGYLCAYRHHGEQQLTNQNFLWVN